MKRIIILIVTLFQISVMSNGQVIMNIYQKGGISNKFLVDNVDSIIFSNSTVPEAVLPTLTTNTIYSITSFWATVGCSITNDGGSIITSRGVCWSTNTDPTVNLETKTVDGFGSGNFSASLTGLQPSTTYYVRAYATNSKGTSYGSTMSFTTLNSTGTVTDIDGNVYQTVTIGTQVWMAENLKTTKYRDGTSIPNVIEANQWIGLTTGAFCDYNNDASNSSTYGRLYNWYAASDSRNIAPSGWHVPTNEEWTTLITYLGGYGEADEKLKETGTAHWKGNYIETTNASGFSALPGGNRAESGPFSAIGSVGSFWTSSQFDITFGWMRDITSDNIGVIRTVGRKMIGSSIRCIKD